MLYFFKGTNMNEEENVLELSRFEIFQGYFKKLDVDTYCTTRVSLPDSPFAAFLSDTALYCKLL